MNTRSLNFVRILAILVSCGFFLHATCYLSFLGVSRALAPLGALVVLFIVRETDRTNRWAVMASTAVSLGFLWLLLYQPGSSSLLIAASTLAALPFFYGFQRAICGKANAVIEQKLHHFSESSLFFALCLLGATIGIVTQITFSFSTDLWGDEAFSLGLTAHPWGEMLSIAATDVHPPLYYIILKALSAPIQHLLPQISIISIAKLVSVLPYLIMLAVSVTKVRRTWGNYVSGLWSLALFAAPSLLSQGVEIRMYAWAMLFVLLTYLKAYDVITQSRKRDWCLVALAGLAAAYTHYYAFIAVIPIYMLLLYTACKVGRRGLLYWSAAAALSVIGYLPWLFIFLNQAHTVGADYWIPIPGLTEYQHFLYFLFQNAVTIGIITLIILFQFSALHRNKEKATRASYVLTGILCIAFTIGVALIATYSIRPVFVNRYLYPGLACFWLSVIIGSKVTEKGVMKLALIIILFGGYFFQLATFCLTERERVREQQRLLQELDKHANAVYVTDSNHLQALMSTLTGERFLSFDPLDNSALHRMVFPSCRTPHITDIETYLNRENHPAYILMLFSRDSGKQQMPFLQKHYVGRFMQNDFFDLYVIPAKGNGTGH